MGDPPAADYTAKVVGRTGVVTGTGPVFWWKGDNLWSVLVVNQMLRRHYPVGMVTRQIAAPYAGIPVGAFVVDTTNLPWAVKFVANRAANYGIDFTTAAGLQMAQVSTLSTPNAQVAVDPNTVFVLKQQMGFANVTTWASANTSIPSSATDGHQQLEQLAEPQHGPDVAERRHLDQRTRTYFGVTRSGVNQTMATGLLPGVTVGTDPASADNGVVKVDYAQNDLLTATYPAHDYAFAYPPYWFTTIPAGVDHRRDVRAGRRRSVPAGLLEQHQPGCGRQRRHDQRLLRHGYRAGPRDLHRLPPDLPRLPGQHRPAGRARRPAVERDAAVRALTGGGRQRRSRRSLRASGKIAEHEKGGRPEGPPALLVPAHARKGGRRRLAGRILDVPDLESCRRHSFMWQVRSR